MLDGILVFLFVLFLVKLISNKGRNTPETIEEYLERVKPWR